MSWTPHCQWLEHNGSHRGTRPWGWIGTFSPSCSKSSKWSCCPRIPGTLLAVQSVLTPSERKEEWWVLQHVQWGLWFDLDFVSPVYFSLVVILLLLLLPVTFGSLSHRREPRRGTSSFWVTGNFHPILPLFPHYL